MYIKSFQIDWVLFQRCCSSFLHLLRALRRSPLRIDKASLLERFGSLKIRNFGYTPSCWQLLRKLMFNFSLFFLYSTFSYFRKSCNISIFPCNRKELKKPFLFATSQTHFIFNSKFYNQIDGVAMGSFLAPVVANIFMGFHKLSGLMNIILTNLNFI